MAEEVLHMAGSLPPAPVVHKATLPKGLMVKTWKKFATRATTAA
ncbi:MAG: hypothetical protein AAFV27_07845 [Pseudomonadota bacterium]